MSLTVPINSITVSTRIRKSVGDISTLAASIKELGLLSPVVINEDNELLAGERRLTACKSIGWTEIPVIVMSTKDAEKKLSIEIAENEQRTGFTREELINAGIELERIEKVKANENSLANLKQFTECQNSDTRSGNGRIDTYVASKLGMSRDTYRKEKVILEHKDLLSQGQFDDWNNRTISTNKAFALIRKVLGEIKPLKSAENKPKEIIKEVEVIKEVIPEGYLSPEEHIKKRDEYIADLREKGEVGGMFIESLWEDINKQEAQIAEYKKQIEVLNAKNVLLEEEKEKDKEHIEQLENDTRTISDAAFLERNNFVVGRAIDGTCEIYDLLGKVRDLIEYDLAPLKFRNCFERISKSDVAREAARELAEKVVQWGNEIIRIVDDNENVIDAEETGNSCKIALYR